jgi:hypothetical protein
MPSSSMGGATREISVCWTMCTLNRYCSDRSWIGHSDATRSIAVPPVNQTSCLRLTVG